jgi:hypothetical protein
VVGPTILTAAKQSLIQPFKFGKFHRHCNHSDDVMLSVFVMNGVKICDSQLSFTVTKYLNNLKEERFILAQDKVSEASLHCHFASLLLGP